MRFTHKKKQFERKENLIGMIYSELGAMYSMLVYLQPKMVSGSEKEDFTYERMSLRQRFLRAEGEEYAKEFEGEKYAEEPRAMRFS